MRFLAILSSLVCWINSILHIVIVLNAFQHSATLPGHEGPFKKHNIAFLNDLESQKIDFCSWMDLVLHIMID